MGLSAPDVDGSGQTRTPGGTVGRVGEVSGRRGCVKEGARPVGTRWCTWPKSHVRATSMEERVGVGAWGASRRVGVP